jgi:hypothetical protein
MKNAFWQNNTVACNSIRTNTNLTITILACKIFFLLPWLYMFAKIYQIQLQVKVFEIWNPPRRSKLQNSELAQKEKIWCASRTRVNLPHIGNSKGIKFVLQRFFLTILKVYPFLVEICMGGTLRSLQFRSEFFYRNCRQICSKVKLSQQNLRILPYLDGICRGGTLRMSNFKILSIFLGSWTPI